METMLCFFNLYTLCLAKTLCDPTSCPAASFLLLCGPTSCLFVPYLEALSIAKHQGLNGKEHRHWECEGLALSKQGCGKVMHWH